MFDDDKPMIYDWSLESDSEDFLLWEKEMIGDDDEVMG
jgi:hypothetical protein